MQQRFLAVLLMPNPKTAVEVIPFLLECVVAIGMAACTCASPLIIIVWTSLLTRCDIVNQSSTA